MRYILFSALLLVSSPVWAQSKFFSTPNRGGVEGAKQNVMLTMLQNEQQRMNACTAAGLIYAPTNINANTDGCTSAAGQREFSGDVTVGGSSTVSGSLAVGGELSVSGPVTLPTGVGIGSGPATTALDVAGAIRVAGETEVCNADRAGAIRYNASIQSMEFCNGTAWGGMGGSGSIAVLTGLKTSDGNLPIPEGFSEQDCSFFWGNHENYYGGYTGDIVPHFGTTRYFSMPYGGSRGWVGGAYLVICASQSTGSGSSSSGGGGVASSFPPGMASAFNLASCPTGWSPVTAARGRFIVGAGTLGGDNYGVGDTGGEARHTLTIGEMPTHTHDYTRWSSGWPSGYSLGGSGPFNQAQLPTEAQGNNEAHENRPPYLAFLYCQKD